MNYILNSREMKEADSDTIQRLGIPSMVLMEKAAMGVVDFLKSKALLNGKIAILCGAGNNGGDGFAVARLLHLSGCDIYVYFAGEESRCSRECANQMEICKRYAIPIHTKQADLDDCAVIIDAVFGIGLQREITGAYKTLLLLANSKKACKIAIDMPSGISADDGRMLGVAFEADYTVTFAYQKTGQLLSEGKKYCGEVIVKDIGIRINENVQSGCCRAYEASDLAKLPKTPVDANKGSKGKALIIAGSREIAGAAYLNALAAYVSGCGMVKIYTAVENRSILLSKLPEAIVSCYEDYDEKQLISLLNWADAVAIGSGMGQSDVAYNILQCTIRCATSPIVMDADALNLIAAHPTLLKEKHTEITVTPHMAEMARLVGTTVQDVCDAKLSLAGEFAKKQQVICVLKDAVTITSVPGAGDFINTSGTPALATAGSGDALTGIICSYLAQGITPSEAAPLGVYVHGLAAERAARKNSVHGMLASDIMQGIKELYKERGL